MHVEGSHYTHMHSHTHTHSPPHTPSHTTLTSGWVRTHPSCHWCCEVSHSRGREWAADSPRNRSALAATYPAWGRKYVASALLCQHPVEGEGEEKHTEWVNKTTWIWRGCQNRSVPIFIDNETKLCIYVLYIQYNPVHTTNKHTYVRTYVCTHCYSVCCKSIEWLGCTVCTEEVQHLCWWRNLRLSPETVSRRDPTGREWIYIELGAKDLREMIG